MSRNSGGTYALPAGNPVVTGTVISSTTHNNTMLDIATALTQSIASTGVTTPTANLPMGTFRHTGVGNASAQACYGSVTDIQNGSLVTLLAVAGTNTITGNSPFTIAAYAANQRFRFIAAAANTSAVTLNIDTLGAKAITKFGATALAVGDIVLGAVVDVVYDGTQFQLLSAFPQTFKGAAAGVVDLLTGANIASAATVNLDTATGNRVHITGTTTITAVTLTRGPRTVVFDGVLTLTHHATNNNLPGAANITTAAGDRATYESDGTTVYCTSYTRASGLPVLTEIVLLATLAPTAAANVDFLTTFTSAYDNYLIIGQGVQPGVGDNLNVQFANAGVVDTGSKYYRQTTESNTPVTGSATSLIVASVTVAASGKGANFAFHVMNANDAVNLKSIAGKVTYNSALTPSWVMSGANGVYDSANAISGIRFFWNGGNNFAATGKIRIYGYNNS